MNKSSQERCIQCRLAVRDCVCRDMPAFWVEHKITLLTSKREERIISNTGRVLRWMLKNVSPVYMGEKGWEEEVNSEIRRTDYTPVILFPTPPVCYGQTMVEVTGKPLNIFVLDTSWKNARRWLHKPLLLPVKKIGLKTTPPSEYHLRKHPGQYHLCSFQAVALLMAELSPHGYAAASLQINEKFKLWVKSLARERGMSITATRPLSR